MVKKKQDAPSKLRFAGLVRVSGEAQAKHGESLRTQHEQIEKAVSSMGGRLSRWYEGQEHATPGYERKLLEAMLRDAAKKRKPFDAVIVADPTRWSRDNENSGSALDHLRSNGIRFFVLGQEFDLYNPTNRYMLQQFASFAELSAGLNLQKAIENRIARAKRNVPTNGSLPWGRTFDKKTETWGVDQEKQELIEDIAQRYIAGEGLKALATEYGLEHTGLHVRLMEKCGTAWPIRFKSPRLNIDETVMLKIPALLSAKTIKAVRRRCELNKTATHGTKTTKYLLSRMVFCGECGGSLSGGRGSGGKRREYRHFGHNCLRGNVQADELEECVMLQLFEAFGNPKALEEAISKATPNVEQAEKEQKKVRRLAEALAKSKKAKKRILDLIAADKISDEDASSNLDELNERESKLQADYEQLTQHLENAPTVEQIKQMSETVASQFSKKRLSTKASAVKRSITHDYKAMTWEQKRALVESVFGGKDEKGNRLGIYVEPFEGESRGTKKQWSYHMKGHLIDIDGCTLDDDRREAAYPDIVGNSENAGSVSSSGSTCRVR